MMFSEVVPIISLLSTMGHPRAGTNIVELQWLTYKFDNKRPSDGGESYLLYMFITIKGLLIIFC